jgi:threonylcarbamoyladenosine tRNA methylthiotransferase MtaB
LGKKKRRLFYDAFLGQKVKILVESKRDRESGMLKGYSRNYLPVLIPPLNDLINQEVEVEVAKVCGEKVFGNVLSPQRTQRLIC